MMQYMADRISREESGFSDETASDDAISVFTTPANNMGSQNRDFGVN